LEATKFTLILLRKYLHPSLPFLSDGEL
jgi:hypothetical protein